MKTFSQFKIQATNKFTGTKLQVDDLLNSEIIIHDYKIEPSKQKEGTSCLHLQIQKDEKMHVFFTGSMNLMDIIKQISKEDFPFKATLVKENRFLKFT